MKCLLDGLPCTRECEECTVEKIKSEMCILDGTNCISCGKCDEIANE